MLSPVDRVIQRVRSVYSGWGRGVSVIRMREDWDRLFGGDAQIISTPDVIGRVPVAWVAAEGASRERVFLYLHGGGYQVGSIASHSELAFRISAASGATALLVDYRLCPEHHFPAPIEDVLAVCDGLVERGLSVETTSFIGDSAGGNLALASVLALRERGSSLPASLVLLSPWTDLQARGESYRTRADSDPIHQRNMILKMAAAYLGDADGADPLASPLNADLRGFPPMLIQVGDRETVLSDAEDLAAAADRAGVSVELQVWPGMIHVFQQFPADLAEARDAIEAIGAFLSAQPKTSSE